MNKKVWLLVFMFMLVIDVKALSFKGGDVIKNVFVLKVKENGEKEYKKGQFIIDSEGDYVYCLEPFVKVNNNSSYNKYTNNFAKYLGLSDELWEKINLISYYGYQYKDDTHNHMDPKWYYITQILIWQNVSPKARFYFTDTFKGNVNSTLFVNEIKEIYNLVNNHYKIPEFDVPDTYIGDTLSIIDRNGVLKKFAGSKNVKINGNILTIKISDLSNKFTLKKGTNNKAFIFVSSDSQNVLKGKMDVPVIANYDIKGLELKGNIKIKKYGEVIDGDKISLEGVIFALFDENKNYIKEATTDKDGKAIFNNLKKGKYFIKEVCNDKKFVLDDNYYEANLKVNENITFIPLPMTEKVLNYIASCDLFIGKGGNSIAEPTFFGHASIISTLSTGIEKTIARYYEKVVGSAIICTNVKKIIKYIHMFSENPELLKKYEMNALKDHKRYGAEPCVNLVYEEIEKWEAHQNA